MREFDPLTDIVGNSLLASSEQSHPLLGCSLYGNSDLCNGESCNGSSMCSSGCCYGYECQDMSYCLVWVYWMCAGICFCCCLGACWMGYVRWQKNLRLKKEQEANQAAAKAAAKALKKE